MGTTQTDVPSAEAPRNTRRNEIVAIALFAMGLLLALCLASYNPNDPSWNAAGQNEARNLVGVIGANVAAAAFQSVGLAAYLLPLLLLAAAWRRFRTRRIHAPLSRMVGLVTLVLASAALLALSSIRPLADSSFHPGGLAGTVIAQALASGLNTVGATVLLIAIAATGLLLATNFSFVGLYEKVVQLVGNRFDVVHSLPARFAAWRGARREQVRLRKEKQAALKAEEEAARATLREVRELTPAERVAEFMKEPQILPSTSVLRGETVSSAQASIAGVAEPARAAAVAAGATIVESRSGRRSIFPSGNSAVGVEDPDAEEMVKGASVLRTKAEAPATGKLPFDADRKKVSYSDYSLPPLEFLNEAPPPSEQADAELLRLATNLAEKCKEFNVTGQIKHICPGPVVTTYEFKPDPGVKYSRVVSLVDDLCLALKAESIRIDRMPGKPHVGIEVPNPRRETIFLREVIESRPFQESPSKLTIALGKTIDGLNYVADLAKMPHLLIAGTTGAGKSVGVNALI